MLSVLFHVRELDTHLELYMHTCDNERGLLSLSLSLFLSIYTCQYLTFTNKYVSEVVKSCTINVPDIFLWQPLVRV